MKISIKRLGQFFSTPLEVEKVQEALIAVGIEIESVTSTAAHLDHVVVAEIESFEKHPDAEKLSLCKINDGSQVLDVVCGANNFKSKDKVALAQVGAVLPNDFKIKKSKIRGVSSFGMLCSESELGFSTESDGIMILPEHLKPGTPLKTALDLEDTILELELTPNRGDCLSLLGVAYELGAALGISVNTRTQSTSKLIEVPLNIEVQDKEACMYYSLTKIENIKVGHSALPLKMFLENSGVRSVNDVVDITNQILLERGQPLHAFDADKVKGPIVVRRAQDGESMVGLDDQQRKLSSEDLVIADQNGPIALAGIMGSAHTAVDFDTQNILLEGAWFDPQVVRKTSRRLSLATESSKRFEREIDGAKVLDYVLSAASLMQEITDGALVGTQFIGKLKNEPHSILVKEETLTRVLGHTIPNAHEYLIRLGFEIEKIQEGWRVRIPPRRPELKREIDVVEEIARIYGYGRIPSVLPPLTKIPVVDSRFELKNKIRQMVSGLGLSEVYTYSFLSAENHQHFIDLSWGDPVGIDNPIVQDQSIMKTSLLPNLIEVWKTNASRQVQGMRMFEIGKVFGHQKGQITESERLAVLFAGVDQPQGWNQEQIQTNFFTAKKWLDDLAKHIKTPLLTKATSALSCFHPGQSALITHQGQTIGWMGALHPLLIQKMDIDGPAVAIELTLQPLLDAFNAKQMFEPYSSFPTVKRDLAFVLNQDVTHQEVMDVIEGLDLGILESVELFDQYQGKGVSKGSQSLAYRFNFCSKTKTLKDKEVDKTLSKVTTAMEKQLGASLR